MAMSQYPFDCKECNQRPKPDFAIFQEQTIDDWLIAYPEQRSIHLHYGYATIDEADNAAEAKFIQQFLFAVAVKYPNTKFFLFVDMSRGDNSESVPPESMQIYKSILKHPQLQQGVFYGGTTAMNYILKLLLFLSNRNINIVSTKEEADQLYQKWLQN